MDALNDKKSIIQKIEKLEKTYNTKEFQKKYNKFFFEICNFLDIPDHIANQIVIAPDPFIKDRILWKFFNDYKLNMTFRDYKCFSFDNIIHKEKRKINFLWVEPLESFSKYNSLPSKEIITSLSAYTFVRSHPYLLTLTKENHFAHDDDEFYSEQKWTDKETAVLIALINLSTDYGTCGFFIGDSGFYIPVGLYGFDAEKLFSVDIKKMHELIDLYEYVYVKTSEKDYLYKTNFSYDKNIDADKIKSLNNKIDRKNSTLVRCLYYYAKACAYALHRMMMEESTALQLFCLDGMQKLFMKKYKQNSIKDINKFLEDKFGWPYGEYLSELYDERTIYVHPENIHGKYWCPPWDADTCFDTLPVVRDMLLIYLLEKYDKPLEPWEENDNIKE